MSSSSKHTEKVQTTLLPPGIISTSDINRLLHEIEGYQDVLRQRDLGKSRTVKLPAHRHSEQLLDVAAILACDISTKAGRQKLVRFLEAVKKEAPIIHVSFAVEPSLSAVARLAQWFREEIHQHMLLGVSVRPGIVGGCVIRSTNKYFDYSIKTRLDAADAVLEKQLVDMVRPL